MSLAATLALLLGVFLASYPEFTLGVASAVAVLVARRTWRSVSDAVAPYVAVTRRTVAGVEVDVPR